jgi:RNA polymerase sigma-70 factor (ECF subfamily)
VDPREEGIARRLRRGDPRAFDEFFDRYAGPLLGYLRGMIGDRATAEDLVQETMLRVHRHIGRYREEGAFRAWVFRIATNLALSELRRRRHAAADALDAGVLGLRDPASPDPHEQVEADERERTMQAALAILADDQRAVILMRVRQEMGIREIAQVLCVPEGTVKSRIHHAVSKLRELVSRPECPQAKERWDEGLR